MECLFDEEKRHFSTWLWIYNHDGEHPMSTVRPEKPGAVPLYYAARLGFRELAEHLIAKYPEHVNTRGGSRETPTGTAAFAGHANILLLLSEHGADIDAAGSDKMTPLSRAAFWGQVECARMLLECGAVIDASSISGMTPLHWAVSEGKTQVVRLLLEHGADVNARGGGGRTPSQFGSSDEIVELLSQYGAESKQ
jgi:ankyrin repeat protein